MLVLVDYVFISEEVVEEVGLVALEGDQMDVAHNLGLDGFQSFGVEE